MRIPRKQQYDQDDPPWLRCISRCVRKSFLCGDKYDHRRVWLEKRIEILAQLYHTDVTAYAIMENHFHIVMRPNVEKVAAMSDVEVANAWLSAMRPMKSDGTYTPVNIVSIDNAVADIEKIQLWRKRIGKVSWFMAALKAPLSRMANKEDNCSSHFWEGRYKSIPLLDRAALISCTVYVDLNPIRAGAADNIQNAQHTSIRKRAAAYAAQHSLEITSKCHTAAHKVIDQQNELHEIIKTSKWLTSITTASTENNGLTPGISIEQYIQLIDMTARSFTNKTKQLHPQAQSTLTELNLNTETWMKSMSRPKNFIGRVIGNAQSLLLEKMRINKPNIQQKCPIYS